MFDLYISGNMSDCIDFVSVLKNKSSLFYQPFIYDLEVTYRKDNVTVKGKSDVGAHDTFFRTKENTKPYTYTLDKLSEIFNLYVALTEGDNVWVYQCGKPLNNLAYKNNAN